MKDLHLPKFKTYEEEATFWDNLDTADFMTDENEWFHFETPSKRAIRVSILPEIAHELLQRANAQGVALETMVNILLFEQLHKSILTR
jgi:hypothetical protein